MSPPPPLPAGPPPDGPDADGPAGPDADGSAAPDGPRGPARDGSADSVPDGASDSASDGRIGPAADGPVASGGSADSVPGGFEGSAPGGAPGSPPGGAPGSVPDGRPDSPSGGLAGSVLGGGVGRAADGPAASGGSEGSASSGSGGSAPGGRADPSSGGPGRSGPGGPDDLTSGGPANSASNPSTGSASGRPDGPSPGGGPGHGGRTGPARRRPLTRAARENRAGLLFVTPTVLVVLVVVVLPILWTVLLSFRRARLVDIPHMGLFGDWSLANFAGVFSSSDFWTSLWTTLLYTVGGTAGSLVLGLVAALALRRPFRGRGLLRGAMLLPYVAPVVAVTFVWQIALSPQFGVVNEWGTSLLGWDDPIAFLSTRDWEVSVWGLHFDVPLALLTVIAFETWRYFPFAFLFLLARLQAVPTVLEEAALVDGATPTQRFRHVLLPQLMPVIALLCVLRFLMTFTKFDDVYLLTGGGSGTDVVAVRVYDFLTARFDVGGAAAQALVLAAVLTALLGVCSGLFAGKVREES